MYFEIKNITENLCECKIFRNISFVRQSTRKLDLLIEQCLYLYGKPAFDNSTTNKIDNVLLEHCGLFHVLPLAVHPIFNLPN